MNISIVRCCLALLTAALAGACSARKPDSIKGPLEEPIRRVGDRSDGGIVVATEQLIRPAGRSVEFSGRPVDLAVSDNGAIVYVKDNRGIVVIDAGTWNVRQELKFPSGGTSMHGIALTRDGRRIYASGAASTLWEGLIGDNGLVKWGRAITLDTPADPPPEGSATKPKAAYPCGIALAPGGKTAYVALSVRNVLAIVDLEAGKQVATIDTGVAPYDVVLSADGGSAFVSNWGGRRAQKGDRTSSSAGTPTVVDERGIASSGTVSMIDLAQRRVVSEIAVGLHPAGMALTRDGSTLFVANANSDTVSLIDVAAHHTRETVGVRPDPALPFGSASNALALSEDEKTLFIADGGNNAIAMVDIGDANRPSHVNGFIPAGWYPGAVACRGGRLFVANVKGIGSRDAAKIKTGWSGYFYRGTVTRIDIPDAPTLARYTEQVRKDARAPEALAAAERAEANVPPAPAPMHVGEPCLFEHVVYVIKENRTYDQVLGDMKQGNGDPSLCIYGAQVTPNHHALAEQFVLLDNFYCNGVISADGHQWAVEGEAADGLEKSFGGFTRSYPFAGDDPLAFVSSGFLWDDALLHGRSFRNFGEMSTSKPQPASATFDQIYGDYVNKSGKITFKQTIAIEELARYSCPDSPGWNLLIPDQIRADVFLRELKAFEQSGHMPNLTILYLPSDHTRGTSPGAPTPAAMVADNDLAVGRVIDGLSHSRFWPRTCVFVIEDDPQNGFDHVDGHRSLCLVASPYTRRRATVSHFYNQTSVLHTMELMLGLPPMNQMDAMAPPMRECFTSQADTTPYTAVSNRIPLNQMNPPARRLSGEARDWAEKSLAQRFDLPDQVDDNTMNRILWYAAHGDSTPYPTAFAGPHGKGLPRLGLRLAPGAKHDDDADDR